jgi:hypothetical protein
MRESKTRAQAGPVRPVEFKQARWRSLAETASTALDQSFADPRGIEALTFQG